MPVTNAIESLNASLRKAVRNKGHFPNDQAATKLIWLAPHHITENWKNPPIAWHAAKAQLAIQFEDRFASERVNDVETHLFTSLVSNWV